MPRHRNSSARREILRLDRAQERQTGRLQQLIAEEEAAQRPVPPRAIALLEQQQHQQEVRQAARGRGRISQEAGLWSAAQRPLPSLHHEDDGFPDRLVAYERAQREVVNGPPRRRVTFREPPVQQGVPARPVVRQTTPEQQQQRLRQARFHYLHFRAAIDRAFPLIPGLPEPPRGRRLPVGPRRAQLLGVFDREAPPERDLIELGSSPPALVPAEEEDVLQLDASDWEEE